MPVSPTTGTRKTTTTGNRFLGTFTAQASSFQGLLHSPNDYDELYSLGFVKSVVGEFLWHSFSVKREGMDEKTGKTEAKKVMSPCDVEALKKCLEENKGDYLKCQLQVEAFRSSCSLKKPDSTPQPSPKLSHGSISDL